jgi:hypothetical protein
MLPIFVDQTFRYAWQTRLTGTGNYQISNGVLRTYATAQGDSAILDYYFPIQAGQIIEIEVWAKDNGSTAKPRVAIDMFTTLTDFQLCDYVEVDQSGEWGLYKLRTVIPFNENRPYGRLVLGKWVGMDAVDCSYKTPIIRVDNGLGASQSVAKGLIKMDNGVPSFHNEFRSYGIKSMSYNQSNKSLEIILNHKVPEVFSGLLPSALVSSTGDNPLIPTVGWFTYDPSGLKIKIRWTNGTSIVDIKSSGVLFVFLTVDY